MRYNQSLVFSLAISIRNMVHIIFLIKHYQLKKFQIRKKKADNEQRVENENIKIEINSKISKITFENRQLKNFTKIPKE